MFSHARIKQDFGKAAATYDQNATLQQRVLSALVQKATPLLSPGGLILDAGAGTGALAKLLPHRFVQLDIAYPMCVEAAKNNSPAINADALSLPFNDASFDAAFSSLLFQWLPDWQKALREMQRVVKPGGLLAISTLGANTLHELRESFAAADNSQHVSPFIKADDFWQKETMTEYFPDFHSILKSLKAIGASNKLAARRKGMMTPKTLQKAEAAYRERFATASGFPVTWEVLYCVKKRDGV